MQHRRQAEQETATDQPALKRCTFLQQDRHPREVAGLTEKIKANPKNANGYLQSVKPLPQGRPVR